MLQPHETIVLRHQVSEERLSCNTPPAQRGTTGVRTQAVTPVCTTPEPLGDNINHSTARQLQNRKAPRVAAENVMEEPLPSPALKGVIYIMVSAQGCPAALPTLV